jgi:hypothetical protein
LALSPSSTPQGADLDWEESASEATYLRRLLIHGARSVLPHLAEQSSPVGCWLRGLLSRAHRNVAIVALANKMARIAWVVLRTGTHYEAQALPTA